MMIASRHRLMFLGFVALPCFLASSVYAEQSPPKAPPIYQDVARSFEERAADLVSHMTLEEKVAQMQNDAPAISRLGVPKYEWWNEALHGVARAGAATVFPQAIGLAASFDPDMLLEIATVISDEGRAKHHEFASRDLRNRYQGLTFWSPNINIFRDPRWGRGQETYGEDPFLTAQMGVAFVKGMQGDHPKYRKTDATAKHFAVHSGPEHNRHVFDARPSERDLYETYLPAFQALVQEANVAAVMGAYNRVNGESASASQRLLLDILRKDWGFKGYVVSDCDSIEDIYKYHKIVETAAEAAALGVKKGLELNCGKTYAALTDAVKQGLISEAEIDDALTRLFYTRFRLGMFDPASQVPWAQMPYSINQSAAHDALARKAAQKSLVLLKNGKIGKKPLLPLDKDLKSIAVIGPTADEVMSLLGNYYGTPAQPVTILQGIREAVSDKTQVHYARGVDLVEGREEPRAAPAIEPQYLRPAENSHEQGLRGEYFRGADFKGEPVLTRIDPRIAFRWDRGAPTDDLVARGELHEDKALDGDAYSVRWTGKLIPPVSGNYEINVSANDGYRLFIDNKKVLDSWELTERLTGESAKVELTAGKAIDIKLEYFEDIRDAEVRLAWRMPGAKSPYEEALEAAKNSDVIVFVGGLTGDVEGEEMKVNYPGFMGGDRTDLRLPKPQRELLQDLVAIDKPLVLVLTGGASLAVDWADQHVPAILMAWYPGQRGGSAVADVLFGDVSPSGRLPVTFYRADAKLPDFEDYSMQGRTYRYYQEKPLYPFGYGLSYSKFTYRDLTLDQKTLESGEQLKISVQVKNSGDMPATEVVQLYVRPIKRGKLDAIKNLREFRSVDLKPGETKTLQFSLAADEDFTYYDEREKAYRTRAGRYDIEVGASSEDIRVAKTIKIK
jgi:beta-glucosidase